MASKRSPACGVRRSGASAGRVGGGSEVCYSWVCTVGARLDVATTGRKYGLLRRPSKVPECVGRPGVGEGWTNGTCGREDVVGGVDGVAVCPAWRRQAHWSWMRRLHCSNSSCSNRSSKSQSSAANMLSS